MCEMISAISAAVSGAMMVTQSVLGGVQANEQAKQQAKIANYNARLADMEAARVAEEGEKERGRLSMQNARLKGQQIARGSAAGLDVWAQDSSMQDILSDTAYFGAADVAEMHNKNMYDISRYTDQALQSRAEAKAYKQYGKQALAGGLLDGLFAGGIGISNVAASLPQSGQTLKITGGAKPGGGNIPAIGMNAFGNMRNGLFY